MSTTTIEFNPEVITPFLSTYTTSPEELPNGTERMRHASMTREEYRKEGMRQIKAALASLK